jgi:large subunit ribosomal protein L32
MILRMVNRMRHNRSQRGTTRSHHALTAQALSVCPDCNAKRLSHKVCANCGKYNGRVVIDVMAKTIKKEKKLKAQAKPEAK